MNKARAVFSSAIAGRSLFDQCPASAAFMVDLDVHNLKLMDIKDLPQGSGGERCRRRFFDIKQCMARIKFTKRDLQGIL